MKIGICIRSWTESGGIGVYTRNIIPNLLALDHSNEYFLFYQNTENTENFGDLTNVHEIYIPSKNKLIWDQIKTPWYAKKYGLDIILHTKLTIPLLTGRKTVMVLHGTERFFYSDFHPKSDRLYFRTIYPQYLKRASFIIAVSDRARLDIMDLVGVEPERIKTIYMAVDPVFRVMDDENLITVIRKKYNLPERFILYVGHIYPGKNVGRLFQAFELIRKKHDVKLVVAGSYRWKYKADLKLVTNLGLENDIVLAGNVPQEDLVGFYNAAELTVFPSFYESFGLTNIEANACGCPLVTSSTGGSTEAAGDAAIYVDPLSVEDIAKGMSRVLSDQILRRELIEKGLKNVQRFSWKATAQKTLSVLESLMPS